METQSDGRGARLVRPLVVALGLSLALLPAACGGLTDGGGGSAEEDPSATTVFRTITVEFTTSTSAAPDAAAGGTPDSAVTLSPNVYEVVAGDYWYGIAKKLNVDVNALWAANNANGDTFLSPGQRLAVPQPGDNAADGLAPPAAGGDAGTETPAESTPTLAPGSTPGSYEIVPGDYWIGIAQKLNVSLNALLAANGATTDTVLIPGGHLKVPQSGN
jgi:LysM repeat protein